MTSRKPKVGCSRSVWLRSTAVGAVDLGAADVATWAPLGAARLLQDNLDGAWDCLRVCVIIDAADTGTRRLAGMTYRRLQHIVNQPGIPAILDQLRQIADI